MLSPNVVRMRKFRVMNYALRKTMRRTSGASEKTLFRTRHRTIIELKYLFTPLDKLRRIKLASQNPSSTSDSLTPARNRYSTGLACDYLNL